MKILQWILTILALFIGLGLLVSGQWIGFIITSLTVLLVAPPLQSQINQRLPWLRSRFLKLFLAVIMLFAALMVTGENLVRFANVAVCTTPVEGQCEQHEIAFIEQTQQISVSAKLRQANTAKQVKVRLDYWPEPEQESEVLSQVFDVPQGEQEVLLALDQVNLQPGNYRITLTPEGLGNKEPVSSEKVFSVWTDPQDVTNRNEGEIDDAGLNNSVTSIKVCEGSRDAKQPCEEDFSELSTQVKILSFTAELPSIANVQFRGDSEITYLLRYRVKTKDAKNPLIQLFRETSDLDRKVGTYTLGIPSPKKGFPPGEYELITSLEARSSRPIRKQFTLK
ncbi:hypothetical protein [Acaryochloris sp. IP29b_bin.137]|uniref:hypothetical protein n=1 Tax=Acaryochloris sp. IP29b_bin.137 TaxID=2969217 RepID=UPI0026197E59|nr:hypothetical protein [Acaryochloris sp. IP29b_bin.137]